jgi:hypothetical protein
VIVAVLEGLELAAAHTHAPALLPVGGSIGNEVLIVAMRKSVAAQLVERHDCINRIAVAEDVEGGIGSIEHAVAVRPLDPSPVEVPLSGHGPVEDRRSRRRLDDLEWDVAGQNGKRVPDPVSSQAAGK